MVSADMTSDMSRVTQAHEAGHIIYNQIQATPAPAMGNYSSANGGMKSGMPPSRRSTLSTDSTKSKMSAVRRMFCLVVTFDLIFTFILWVIFTQLIGQQWKAFIDQVENYNFDTSLFDVVLVSAFRFLVLILSFALFTLNHWWPVAITTFLTNAFLLAKCFIFHFNDNDSNVNPLSYLLLISSFVIAWGETWFLDFKVLPKEQRSATQALIHISETTPLLHGDTSRQGYTGQLTDDHHVEYYSADSASDSDNETDVQSECDRFQSLPSSKTHSRNRSRSSTISFHTDEEYIQQGQRAYDTLWQLYSEKDSWSLHSGKDCADCVYSRQVDGIGKVFMLHSFLDASPRCLFNIHIYGMHESPTWNPTVTECRILQSIDDNTDIAYNIAAEAAGGLVSSRDFVTVRHWGVKDEIYMSAGIASTHPDMPEQRNFVRGENGPGGWIFMPVPGEPERCEFVWILNTNLHGWLMQSLVDQALAGVLIDYLKYLNTHIANLKNEGRL